MKRKALLIVSVFFLALLFVPGEVSAQCAMCKQSAESTLKSNPGSIARGLNSGILYLMAVPYLAIMFIFRKQIAVVLRHLLAKWQKRAA